MQKLVRSMGGGQPFPPPPGSATGSTLDLCTVNVLESGFGRL